ncbi:MAG: FxsA family protein, partial [Planctomycetota bacterium]
SAGSTFGVLPVVAACVGTAVLGGVIMRIQGFQALQSARTDMDAGKPPVEAAVDGVFLLAATPFLMTPGFITDGLGFLMLVPPVRRAIARYALQRLKRAAENGQATFTIRRF